MSFKSGAVVLGTSDTDIFECPATFSGAALLSIANVTGTARTYTLKLYKASTVTTVTIASGVTLAANSAIQSAARVTLEAGDKIIGSASAAAAIAVTRAVTLGPPDAKVGLTPEGEYDSGTTYARNALVSVAGVGSFISMQDGNVGHAPASSPAYWMINAEIGEQGPAGVAGASALTVVRVVSTGSASYATDFEAGDAIDGVTLATNDLVLRASATLPERNGVYVVQATGAASRHTDFATYNDHCGAFFSVMEGTTYHDTLWQCTSDTGGTLNTTAITIQQFSQLQAWDSTLSLTQPQQAVAMKNLGVAPFNLNNGKIVPSTSGGALTLALKGLDGNDPSASNPVVWFLPDGTPVFITSAMSLVIPSGAELGIVSALAYALNVAFAYSGGTTQLVVKNGSDSSGFYPFDAIESVTAIGTGSDSAGVTYGTSAMTDAWIVPIARLEYRITTHATGTYANAPTYNKLWFPGMKGPGDLLRSKSMTTNTAAIFTGVGVANIAATNATLSIQPFSIIDRVLVAGEGGIQTSTSGAAAFIQIMRNGAAIGVSRFVYDGAVTTATAAHAEVKVHDSPGTTSPITYAVGAFMGSAGTGAFPGNGGATPAAGGTLAAEVRVG